MLKVLLFSLMAMAHSDHAAHTQAAHVHGAGKVSLAFDGKKGKLEFHAPAESIYGFEHAAKSKKDKQKKDEALAKLGEKMAEMVVLDPSLKCEIKLEMYEVIEKKNHSDVEGEFNISCEAPVAGSTITFNFQKVFSRLKKVQVEVLADQVQKSLEVGKNGETLELK
ncbi:ZrgA family zinc uptake protein [Bdellovibrio bacteriovorus]|uniref:DUF2796 domain-containing protein n=1 Tax=Bdellovibrio bacteriovorus str. Tiberius TaxID=1069642 RepID=K7YSY4_BDEBC|nr:DUF2796 domain-containing protein [Bdellovibrio bacteriovorus]AFY00743.1 hypothetical protein Bdt_1043 [Bdellovibrio bacteriovorus str. Tiberius]